MMNNKPGGVMMKKYLFIFGCALILLGACQSETNESKAPATEETAVEETPIEESSDDSAEEAKTPPEESEDLADPIELQEGVAYPISYFGTDESYRLLTEEDGNGTIPVEFEGFNVNVAIMLVDLEPNEEYSYLYEGREKVRAFLAITEAENTNDFDVDYNGGMTIITDTKEQVSADFGLMGTNPIIQTYYGQVEQSGYYLIPIKDDSEPQEITVMMDGPWKVVDGSVNAETGQMGEEQRFDLKAFEE